MGIATKCNLKIELYKWWGVGGEIYDKEKLKGGVRSDITRRAPPP